MSKNPPFRCYNSHIVKNILISLVAFFLGCGIVLGYQYWKTKQAAAQVVVSPTSTQAQITPEPTFALVPPTTAVSGTLTTITGHAQKYSRGDTEYKEASVGAQILLGESVATKLNSSAKASVTGIVSVNMGPMAEVVFANLFPNNFVLQQKAGKIDYFVTKPISVRVLHALVKINPGETIINIIDTDMSVTVKTGSVEFAIVDTDNQTNVWNLKAGQRANIDDEARQVYLVQTR